MLPITTMSSSSAAAAAAGASPACGPRRMRAALLLVFGVVMSVTLWQLTRLPAQTRLRDAAGQQARSDAGVDASAALITEELLWSHVRRLADDATQGRAPGTDGEQLACHMIAGEFAALGLLPLGDDGTYFQKVPLLEREVTRASASWDSEVSDLRLDWIEDFVVFSDSSDGRVDLSAAELVFLGHGIDAPPFEWNDFKSVDLRGKVVVLLNGEPAHTADEPGLFHGAALSYYGRWMYKVAKARALGAIGAVLVHTEASVGYSFAVLQSSRTRMTLAQPADSASPSAGELRAIVWITEEMGNALARAGGARDLADWVRIASQRDFVPRVLAVQLAVSFEQRVSSLVGMNVVALLPSAVRSPVDHEAVVVMAHHDHLGVDEELLSAGHDGIYNGAIDNASGVAVVLALARALSSRVAPKLERDVVFVTFTAEEHGLLGALYFAAHPPVPLEHCVASVNYDVTNAWGEAPDVVGLGAEICGMERVFAAAAEAEGMTVGPDPAPHGGSAFRADSWALTMHGGVPPLYVWTGAADSRVAAGRRDFVARHYHRPSDSVENIVSLAGTLQQARIGLRLVASLASGDAVRPACRPGWGVASVDGETVTAPPAI